MLSICRELRRIGDLLEQLVKALNSADDLQAQIDEIQRLTDAEESKTAKLNQAVQDNQP